jgi:hypothetical protein
MSENRRKKDSAKLVWDTKPKRAPNPRDIEFQTAEIVIPNPQKAQGNLPLFAVPQSGLTSLFPGQMRELPLGGFDIDKTKMNRLIWGDNLLAMQALLAQGYAGKIDLIYIDPPFKSDADYSFQLTVEEKRIIKEASVIDRVRASQSRLTKGTQHSHHIVIVHRRALTFLSQTTSVSGFLVKSVKCYSSQEGSHYELSISRIFLNKKRRNLKKGETIDRYSFERRN